MNGTRTANSTNDQVIYAGRCRLKGVYPELTTTGTISIYDDAAASTGTLKHVCAIGLTQAGKTFGPDGIVMQKGIVVDQSAGTDISLIVWEPF